MKPEQTPIEVMNMLNEALVFLGFLHEERLKIFMAIRKHPEKFALAPQIIKKNLKNGVSRKELRSKVFKRLCED